MGAGSRVVEYNLVTRGRRIAAAALVLCPLAFSEQAAAADTAQERLGYAATARVLVLHADDLGMSHSVNVATFDALEKGWITSASILVPCPWFPEVARFAQAHPDVDLGIHLALTSEWTTFRWGPVAGRSAVPSLLDASGYLPPEVGAVVANAKADEAERELRAQIEMARHAGVKISHLDSHMFALIRSAPLIEVYRRLSREYGIPAMIARDVKLPEGTPALGPEALIDRVVGLEAGVLLGEWRAAYEKVLAPLGPGVYELIVHLGHAGDEMQGATSDHPDWGAAWRQADLDLVRSQEFQRFLTDQGFILVNWRQLAKASKQD
jgi:predicted glycoside hydrolase/deacetylase ChbG (UPF0249 family)